MATGCADKAGEYMELARDVRKAGEANGACSGKRDLYYSLLERYDNIRTSPTPALPEGSD
jgi:hypothetical protein